MIFRNHLGFEVVCRPALEKSLSNELRCAKNRASGFRPGATQTGPWRHRRWKMARVGKLWIYKVEKLYYPGSEKRSVDQLYSYCRDDLII